MVSEPTRSLELKKKRLVTFLQNNCKAKIANDDKKNLPPHKCSSKSSGLTIFLVVTLPLITEQ